MTWSKFIIVYILGIFAIFLLATFLVLQYAKTSKPTSSISRGQMQAQNSFLKSLDKCQNVCVTKECIYQSSALLNSLDESIDKCDNFYQHVCGMYPKDNFHIHGRTVLHAFRQRSEIPMYARLLRIQRAERGKSAVGSKRGLIYDTCMKSQGGKSEFRHLLSVVNSVLGKWPVSNPSYSKSDVDRWLSEFFLMGEFSFFTIDIVYRNIELFRIVFSSFASMIPAYVKSTTEVVVYPDCEFISENSTDCRFGALHEYLIDLFTTNGISEEISHAVVEEACRVDEILRDACEGSDMQRSQKRTFECGHWCRVLILALDKIKSEVNITSTNKRVLQRNLLESIQNMIDEESPSVIANYLAVRFLLTNMKLLELYTKSIDFNARAAENFYSDSLLRDRSFRCFSFVVDRFPFTFFRDHLELNHAQKKVELVSKIYESIQKAAVSLVDSSSFSESFKQRFQFSILSPEVMIETTDYIKYIMHLWNDTDPLNYMSPNAESFAMNMIETKRANQLDKLLEYRQGKYFLDNKYKNHFYAGAGAGGQIDFGFALIDFLPTDSIDDTLLIHYAAIGFLLAHEFCHSMTDLFQHFASNNQTEGITLQKFDDCIVGSYNAFQIPYTETHINGRRTVGENEADFFGLEITYEALKKAIPQQVQNKVFPGLNQTFGELFLSFYVSNWCEIGDHSGYKLLFNDVHMPSEHRANGPLMYSEEFSKVLDCPDRTRMNPMVKCKFLV